jgi:hypothetical protein
VAASVDQDPRPPEATGNVQVSQRVEFQVNWNCKGTCERLPPGIAVPSHFPMGDVSVATALPEQSLVKVIENRQVDIAVRPLFAAGATAEKIYTAD